VKAPEEKSAAPGFTFKMEGHVVVICKNCGHSFMLSNTLDKMQVWCPFCSQRMKVPGAVLKFFATCENQAQQ